jgi:hypothetical protein
MTNGQQTKGTFLLILALLLTQFGLLLLLHQTTLMNPIVNLVNNIEAVELLGLFMMLAGSILVVISVMALMYSMLANPVQDKVQSIQRQISQIRYNTKEDIMQLMEDMTATKVRSCRFCGAPIKKDEPFCAACGKAQA